MECRVKRRMQRMAEEAVLWMVKVERVFRGDENIEEERSKTRHSRRKICFPSRCFLFVIVRLRYL